MGFVELLTLMLVAAKLTGYLDWSWWAVFSPELVSVAILCVLGGIMTWERSR